MTCILFHDGILYTDSFVVEDSAEFSPGSLQEKTYHDPKKRFLFTSLGGQPWHKGFELFERTMEKLCELVIGKSDEELRKNVIQFFDDITANREERSEGDQILRFDDESKENYTIYPRSVLMFKNVTIVVVDSIPMFNPKEVILTGSEQLYRMLRASGDNPKTAFTELVRVVDYCSEPIRTYTPAEDLNPESDKSKD